MPIDYEIETLSEANTIGSLANATAIRIIADHRLTAIEADFIMADMEVAAQYSEQHSDEPANNRGNPSYLVLHAGQANDADITAALVGTNNADFTPGTGTDPLAAQRALNAQVISIIPFKLVAVVKPDTAGVIEKFYEAQYHGPPLMKKSGEKSWTFPRQKGWAWSFITFGGAVTSNTEISFFGRYKGVWRQ